MRPKVTVKLVDDPIDVLSACPCDFSDDDAPICEACGGPCTIVQAFITSDVLGLRCNKCGHNFTYWWSLGRDYVARAQAVANDYQVQKSRIRPDIEDETLIALGLGDCCTIGEAASEIHRLKLMEAKLAKIREEKKVQ